MLTKLLKPTAWLPIVLSASVTHVALAEPVWTFHGPVADGGQLDAMRGADGRIHLVSSRYYQLDSTGTVVLQEEHGDGRQGPLDFPPAIAVGDDGTVHLVTRHGGSWTEGHDLRYRRRSAEGIWLVDYLFGAPVARNYVVGAASGAGDQVYLSSSEGGADVWGTLHLFEELGGSAAPRGDLSGLWRSDCDTRMRGRGGNVYLVSGKPDAEGRAYFAWAVAGSGLGAELGAHATELSAGTGRRGFADLYIDATGSVHVVYGALRALYYQRFGASGERQLGADALAFDGLGDWHLSVGLGAVAASDDGQVVAAVALRSDGSQQAADSDLLWAVSTDQGQTWSTAEDSGRNSDGGEGRRRPRMVAIGHRFFVLFWDNESAGLSLATLEVPIDADGDGHESDVDCDDTNPTIHPSAPELCGNGLDDDCDEQIDEGCGGTGGEAGAAALGGSDPGSTGGAGGASTQPPASPQATDSGGCGCRFERASRSASVRVLLLAGALLLFGRIARATCARRRLAGVTRRAARTP